MNIIDVLAEDWQGLTEEERYGEWSDGINDGSLVMPYTHYCDFWDAQ